MKSLHHVLLFLHHFSIVFHKKHKVEITFKNREKLFFSKRFYNKLVDQYSVWMKNSVYIISDNNLYKNLTFYLIIFGYHLYSQNLMYVFGTETIVRPMFVLNTNNVHNLYKYK